MLCNLMNIGMLQSTKKISCTLIVENEPSINMINFIITFLKKLAQLLLYIISRLRTIPIPEMVDVYIKSQA